MYNSNILICSNLTQYGTKTYQIYFRIVSKKVDIIIVVVYMYIIVVNYLISVGGGGGCPVYYVYKSGLVSSVRRALASKLRGPGFKSQPGTVGGPVTIIMWGARPCWKLALS